MCVCVAGCIFRALFLLLFIHFHCFLHFLNITFLRKKKNTVCCLFPSFPAGGSLGRRLIIPVCVYLLVVSFSLSLLSSFFFFSPFQSLKRQTSFLGPLGEGGSSAPFQGSRRTSHASFSSSSCHTRLQGLRGPAPRHPTGKQRHTSPPR